MFLKSVTILKEKMTNFQGYPFALPLIKRMDSIEISSNVTFFVGENGSGKSTLLEAIAYQCGFNTAGGGRNNTYYAESSLTIHHCYSFTMSKGPLLKNQDKRQISRARMTLSRLIFKTSLITPLFDAIRFAEYRRYGSILRLRSCPGARASRS